MTPHIYFIIVFITDVVFTFSLFSFFCFISSCPSSVIPITVAGCLLPAEERCSAEERQ